MKVGTDGVLLGAWAVYGGVRRVLDIGTGTGLIALMTAQRAPHARIDAIELDQDAFLQAAENVARSPWSDRIRVIHDDFLSWSRNSGERYDLILCNPPYFKSSGRITDRSRQRARQDDTLPLNRLIRQSAGLLTATGTVYLIIPHSRFHEAVEITARADLNITRILKVKGTQSSQVKRVLVALEKKFSPVEENELVLHDVDQSRFSDAYRQLTMDFYLDTDVKGR